MTLLPVLCLRLAHLWSHSAGLRRYFNTPSSNRKVKPVADFMVRHTSATLGDVFVRHVQIGSELASYIVKGRCPLFENIRCKLRALKMSEDL